MILQNFGKKSNSSIIEVKECGKNEEIGDSGEYQSVTDIDTRVDYYNSVHHQFFC